MNRRVFTAATALSLLPTVGTAQSSNQSKVMTMLIEEVIRDGDMSNLDSIVTSDVTIATLGVTNIDEFMVASQDGYNARQSEYSRLDMEIVSMAENGDWVHAMVNATGDKQVGRKSTMMLFYVGQFRDGLISNLYFG